jgi:hypothetical protein
MSEECEEKKCSKKLVDALIDRLDRMLEILGRIASAAEARRVVAQPKPRDHREALLYEMMREESSLRWADAHTELNTDGMRKNIKQGVLILWFASKLWRHSVKSSTEMYTKLFEACKAYDGHSEDTHTPSDEESAQFNKGSITRELTAWARSHCRECFGEIPDTPTMIRKFHETMKATPPTA